MKPILLTLLSFTSSLFGQDCILSISIDRIPVYVMDVKTDFTFRNKFNNRIFEFKVSSCHGSGCFTEMEMDSTIITYGFYRGGKEQWKTDTLNFVDLNENIIIEYKEVYYPKKFGTWYFYDKATKKTYLRTYIDDVMIAERIMQ